MVLVCSVNFSPKIVLQGPYSSRTWNDGDCGPCSVLAFANILTCGAFWTEHLSTSSARGAMIAAERDAGNMGDVELGTSATGSTTVADHQKAWNSNWMQHRFDAINYNKPGCTWFPETANGAFDSNLVPALASGKNAMLALKYGPIDWYPATSEGDAAYPTRHKISGQWCGRFGHMVCVYNYRTASGISGIADGTPIVSLVDPLANGGGSSHMGSKCNAPAPPGVEQKNFYSTSPGHVSNGLQTVPVSVIRAACGLYAGSGRFCGAYSQAASAIAVPPVAGFTWSQNSGTLAIRYTDTSSGGPTAWSWAFGDGAVSTAQSPTHTFPSAGSYSTNLTISNTNGSDSAAATVTVAAIPPAGSPPTAAFTWSQSSGTFTENFTDTSTNAPTTWAWTFGDGATSTSRNPSHTYASSPATYTVGLTVTNGFGSSSVSHSVSVAGIPPIAAFAHSQTLNTLTVNFTDASTRTPTSWAWTFGDGGTSTAQNPSRTYATAGDYTVTLTATNASGSNLVSQVITVDPIPAAPPADTGTDPTPNDPCGDFNIGGG